jgi:uncharacterized membrane protein AbrB (regulator of aidB expression)
MSCFFDSLEEPMFLDMLVTILASAVIGWNLGSWLVPASWVASLWLAAIIMKVHRPEMLGRPQRDGPAHRM